MIYLSSKKQKDIIQISYSPYSPSPGGERFWTSAVLAKPGGKVSSNAGVLNFTTAALLEYKQIKDGLQVNGVVKLFIFDLKQYHDWV